MPVVLFHSVYGRRPAVHLFTDHGTPDHDGPAADLAWQRSLSFLNGL